MDVRALAEDEFQGLGAIAGHLDVIGQIGLAQGAQSQGQVVGVVLDQQDFNGIGVAHDLGSSSRVK